MEWSNSSWIVDHFASSMPQPTWGRRLVESTWNRLTIPFSIKSRSSATGKFFETNRLLVSPMILHCSRLNSQRRQWINYVDVRIGLVKYVLLHTDCSLKHKVMRIHVGSTCLVWNRATNVSRVCAIAPSFTRLKHAEERKVKRIIRQRILSLLLEGESDLGNVILIFLNISSH
jgi:hypothetical protein